MPPRSRPRVLYWFRTDLRLHDSPALHAALDLDPEVLYPIWCWDDHYVYRARVGPNRFRFLLDCQEDVSASITRLNPKSRLFVLREPAVTLLPKLFRAWRISHLVFEKDTDAYARERDARVMAAAGEAGVKVVVRSGRTLWDSDELVRTNGGRPTMSMSQVRAAGAKLGEVALPLDAPTSLPDPGELGFGFEQTTPEKRPDLNDKHRDGEECSYSSGIAGPRGDFAVPTMEELGLPAATTPHRGGETVALRALDSILSDEEYTATFEKPKTSPAAFEPPSTCLTSPHLHFGALSCRHFYHKVLEAVESRRKAKKPVSEPPTSLTGQLLFRDMYFAAQAALGREFGQTYNNSHCRFIPWHLPSKIDTDAGIATADHEIDDAEKEEWLRRWTHGQTGFPWIDAIMRQLRLEGWIHHLARHSVACFLTRGGCYISWERGAEVFEELLLDHEPACNVGNWQWLSCTAFFAQFYRCYSPIAFGRKWDPEGHFVRKFVPELARLPRKFIYEPHKAPIADQRKAGVRITGDGEGGGEADADDGLLRYPKPMFDFDTRRDVCIRGMKAAYAVGMYGNDPRVLDGTWKAAFDDHAEGPTEGDQGGPGGTMRWEDMDDQGDDYGEEASTEPDAHVDEGKGEGEGEEKRNLRSARGQKREHSQTTLDGMFKKKASK